MSDTNVSNDGALHQLLAVRQDLEKKGQMILTETVNTFIKKSEHFDGVIKTYTPMAEGSEEIPPEVKEMVTTVGKKVLYSETAITAALDARVSVEESNASGTVKSELVVQNGDQVQSFGSFSAISLLALEEWLTRIRTMYQEIPTLDPTKTWFKDTNQGEGVYKTNPEIKFRSVTQKVPLVLSPATDRFPAQVQVYDNNVQVGKYSTEYLSGKITPAEKSSLLERIDNLIIAVKKAKAKANQATAIQVRVGQKLFDFINSGSI